MKNKYFYSFFVEKELICLSEVERKMYLNYCKYILQNACQGTREIRSNIFC